MKGFSGLGLGFAVPCWWWAAPAYQLRFLWCGGSGGMGGRDFDKHGSLKQYVIPLPSWLAIKAG